MNRRSVIRGGSAVGAAAFIDYGAASYNEVFGQAGLNLKIYFPLRWTCGHTSGAGGVTAGKAAQFLHPQEREHFDARQRYEVVRPPSVGE